MTFTAGMMSTVGAQLCRECLLVTHKIARLCTQADY